MPSWGSPSSGSAAPYDALRCAPVVPAARRRSRAAGEVLRHDVLPAHPVGHQIAELPGQMEAVAPVERGGVLVARHHGEPQHARTRLPGPPRHRLHQVVADTMARATGLTHIEISAATPSPAGTPLARPA